MKPWTNKLREHVETWNPRLDRAIAGGVYHFTNVDNAASILNSGEILSRAGMEGAGHTDCASASVIAHTDAEHKKFVRLYFRARTPTQWHNEGIRLPQQLTEHQAHCPIPVFFSFGLVELVARDSTQFSNGNMGSAQREYGASLDLWERIPFELVYHRRPLHDHPSPKTVIFHRCAEVLVPDRLDLDILRRVRCRSNAERHTLLHLLSDAARKRYAERIAVGGGEWFTRDWMYVEEASTSGDCATFQFHAGKTGVRPVAVEFVMRANGRRFTWKGDCNLREKLVLRVAPDVVGVATLKIAGHVAFQGQLDFRDIPF